MIVADSAYKTPAIARELIEAEITLLFPYKRPMTKEGFFKKYEYLYDEYNDCYICHTLGNKTIYELRKETIERIFVSAKEDHGFRYTQYRGKA